MSIYFRALEIFSSKEKGKPTIPTELTNIIKSTFLIEYSLYKIQTTRGKLNNWSSSWRGRLNIDQLSRVPSCLQISIHILIQEMVIVRVL